MTVEPEMPTLGWMALVRFVSELAMLAALAYLGWRVADGGLLGVLLAVLLPILAAGLWGAFVGPRASRRLRDPARFGLEVLLFGAAVTGLAAYDRWVLAVLLTVGYLSSTMHGRRGS